MVEDILKILLTCIKDEQFIIEAKNLGKIIVKDVSEDKSIEN